MANEGEGDRFNELSIRFDEDSPMMSRECPAIEVGQSLTGTEVVTVVERLVKEREKPERIQIDNGSGFVSRAYKQVG